MSNWFSTFNKNIFFLEAKLLESDTCKTTTKSRIGTKRKTKSEEMEESSPLYQEPENKKARSQEESTNKRQKGRKSARAITDTNEVKETDNPPQTEVAAVNKRGKGRKSTKATTKTEARAENIEADNPPQTEEVSNKRGVKGRKSTMPTTKAPPEKKPRKSISANNVVIQEKPRILFTGITDGSVEKVFFISMSVTIKL